MHIQYVVESDESLAVAKPYVQLRSYDISESEFELDLEVCDQA